jgi:cytochrome P450
LVSNASLLIAAGSETTATALSAATYYLGIYPETFKKLAAEIRSAFRSEEDITLTSAQHLSYLQGVIDEAMRLFPAAPGTQPRIISPGGDVICGRYVPAGVSGIFLVQHVMQVGVLSGNTCFADHRWSMAMGKSS